MTNKMEWQPIETAPKDGRKVLAWSRRHGMVASELSFTKKSIFARSGKTMGGMVREMKPTHWMPLPPPPDQPK